MNYLVPRTALIDGDIVAYTAACWARSCMMGADDLEERIEADIITWMGKAHADRVIVCLSCSRASNFRRDHYVSYKDHRKTEDDPPLLEHAKDLLRQPKFRPLERKHIEADDLMGILGFMGKPLPDGSIPVIVTIDKDLRQIPGWHVNPTKEDFPTFVTEDAADLFFHKQWMMGDATDNLPGLWKVGPAKAESILAGVPLGSRTAVVLNNYASHPKGYDLAYALGQARCVRILRPEEWDRLSHTPKPWTPPEGSTPAAWQAKPEPAKAQPEPKTQPTDNPKKAGVDAPKKGKTNKKRT